MKRGTVKVGSRGSKLALAQTQLVIRRLNDVHPKVRFVVVPITTSGDRIASATELRNAGKGLFVKELERALLKRQIQMAVHSMKDMPSELPDGLAIGAVLERADASDVFIGRDATPIEKLLPRSQVGTSSLRRQAILKSILPHLEFVELRGNLDTRLQILRDPRSKLSGIVVAAAGVERLGASKGLSMQLLPRDRVVPAAGQGAIAVEVRAKDEAMKELLEPVHHHPTAACCEAERELLRRLEGGCQVPLGIHAESSDDGLIKLVACLASLDGRRVVRGSQTGTVEEPLAAAEALETILNSRGAQEILAELRPRPARRAKPSQNGQLRRRKAARPKSRRRARARR